MGDILYQPEPRKTMNGTNTNPSNCCNDNRSGGDNLNDRNEAAEFERRRKLVEEAKKHLLSVQKV